MRGDKYMEEKNCDCHYCEYACCDNADSEIKFSPKTQQKSHGQYSDSEL